MRFLFSFIVFLSLALLLIHNGVRANEPTPSASDNNNNNKDNNNNKAVHHDPFHLHFPFPHQPDLFHSLSNDFQSLRSSISQQIAAIDEKMRSHRQQIEKRFQDVWASVNVNNPLEQFQSINNNNNNNKPSIPVTGDNSSPPLSSVASKPEAGPLSSPSVTHTSISLSKVDLIEKNDRYLINAELAGIPKDKISITVDNGLITIEGKNEQKKEGGGGDNEKYHYSERSYSSIKRSLRIPSDVDPSTITANYENGLLMIHLPKNNQAIKPPTQVHIQ